MRARRLFAPDPMASRPPRRGHRSGLPVRAAWISAALALACTGGVPLTLEVPEPTASTRALYARINLQRARALRAEGRLEAAASATRRGLEHQPHDARLHRLRAALLEELGQREAAAHHRARADALAPAAPAPPEMAHELAAEATQVLVVLLSPAPSLLRSPGAANRVPRNWPAGPEAELLASRVATRLPNAAVIVVPGEEHPSSQSVAAAKHFLAAEAPDAVVSLRLERTFCGSSVKDGDFAVAWLRVATALPGDDARVEAPHLVRVSLEDSPRDRCETAAIASAFERALELRAVRDALAAGPPADTAFASAAVRSLFPVLGWRLQHEVLAGRRHLAVGDLARAVERFERAALIDPADPVAAAFLDDALRSLALARLLAPGRAADPLDSSNTALYGSSGGAFDPQLSRSQRLGMEAQLAYESRRREEMLSALAVLYELRSAPTPGTVANMRPVEMQDPTATGIALALPKVPPGTAVEVRTLFAPDGDVLARYYFAEDSPTPILREEDRDDDGVSDRWVGYQEGVIREIWERTGTSGLPTLHVVYTPGGDPIERIELDHDGDGRLERVFVYDAGKLREESSDTNGDGAFDRFERFDASGSLTLREEDVDGDEEIDVRTAYTEGRVVRREILNPELLTPENSSDFQ